MKKHALALSILLFLFLITFSSAFAQNSSEPIAWTKIMDGDVRGLALSPDGSLIAFRNPQTQTLEVRDWQQNKTIWEVPVDGVYDSGVDEQAAWSPDGSRLVWVFPDGDLTIRDAATGTRTEAIETVLDNLRIVLSEVSQGEISQFTDVAWNHDGTQLAVMTSSYIIIFDLLEMKVQSVIDLLVVPSTLHDNLSSFAWSPDNSTFAAYHFRLQDGHEVFPLDIVMGFWNRNGHWLGDYGTNTSADPSQNCLTTGKDIWDLHVPGLMGGTYEWSPDNRSLAISEAAFDHQRYSICTLSPDGKLAVAPIANAAPVFIHWSSDQKWLYAILTVCTLFRTHLDGDHSTGMIPFGKTCYAHSAAWSQNDRFVALAAQSGLWIGTLN